MEQPRTFCTFFQPIKRLTGVMLAALSDLALTLLVLSATQQSIQAAPAAELHVCPSGCAYSSLQAAVDAANDGDIIKLAAGVYTDVHARPRNDIATTGVVTQIVYLSKTVSIQGGYTLTNWGTPYPLTQPTTLDAQSRGRVVYITGQISPSLEGLRITGGNADRLSREGGGLYAIHAALAMSNCTIVSNTTGNSSAGYGSGVYLYNAAATLAANHVTSNTAGYGGAVFLYNTTATLTANQITSNTDHTYEKSGGLHADNSTATLFGNIISGNNEIGVRLHNYSTATLISNTIFNNFGGVYLDNSAATLTGNTISDNLYNGGIYMHSSSATINENIISNNAECGGVYMDDSNARLARNTISNNTAYNSSFGGGGLCQLGGYTVLTDNVISNNSTDESGGGVYSLGTATLIRNTIVSNTAMHGGVRGIGFITLTENIITDNTAGGGGGAWLEGEAVSTRNTIAGNTAILGGGVTAYSDGGIFTFNGDIISHNKANAVGGIDLWGSDVKLINSVIANNQSNYEGSGLYVERSRLQVWHATIASNTGSSGIYATKDINVEKGYSSVALTNTILASHTVGISLTQGNTVTLNGVLWHNTPLTIAHPLTAAVSVQNEHWGDPAFAADGYHLTPRSAAIDWGMDADVYTDIDGEPRPMGLGFDLGADELRYLAPALYVTKHATPNPVQPGAPLSYTIHLLNTGNVGLHAAITDVLPVHILPGHLPGGTALIPGGVITWTSISLAPGDVWTTTFTVTVEAGYEGVLTNVVRAAAEYGVTAAYTQTTPVILLPPAAPILLSPPNGTITTTRAITLAWQPGPGSTPLGYNVLLDGVVLTTTRTASPALLAAGSHTWTVRAFNSSGYSDWADAWTLTVQEQEPRYPIYLPLVLRNG